MADDALNIEDIMNEIRGEIAAKGYRSSDLDLPDVELYYTDDMKPSFFSRVKKKIRKLLKI